MVANKKATTKKKTVTKKTATIKKSAGSGASLSLPSILDISCVESFYSDLKEIAVPGANITLNARKVEKITTPAIQLLLAASITVKSKKGSMVVEDPSKEMQAIFLLLGLDSQLNEWK